MLTVFFAQRVILKKTAFEAVPEIFQKGVAEILINSNLYEFIPSEYYGEKTPDEQ